MCMNCTSMGAHSYIAGYFLENVFRGAKRDLHDLRGVGESGITSSMSEM